MPACRLTIENPQGNAPFHTGMPDTVTVVLRVSRDCNAVDFVVRLVPDGNPLVSATGVPVVHGPLPSGQSPDDPASDGLAQYTFAVNPALAHHLSLGCERLVWIEAHCAADPSCATSAHRRITCKGHTVGGGPGGGSDGGGGTNGGAGTDGGGWNWPWPLPPDLMCGIWKRTFAYALLAGLLLLIAAICLPQPGLWVAMGVAFGVAAVAHELWIAWCIGATTCERIGLRCWVFKRAFLGGLAVAVVLLCPWGVLGALAYGVIGGWLVMRLRTLWCPVPSVQGTPF